MAAWSQSPSTRQYTVLRMRTGGSAGLRTITALPRCAPPTTFSAVAVVSVNSSMLARVPGPADFDEIDDTISA
ncbi:hypothetical protein MSG_03539 [Mycobacterium shigaense]|uniref:Uncharacterized protein n=1 Tax=Mycobacterium shigaense TaxID=722731 RepID=A0A1Z4EL19_9MYCO|nr:hypothetical protein MSG_03539 [Mycobacterium shigaense]